jgi:hypothetical protein
MQAVLECLAAEPALQSEFWDFAGYNKMSTEAFTQPPEKISRTVYFWEYSHFKKPVGDLVLSRIFTGQPAGFGQLVTLATLPDDLKRLQTEKENWHAHGELAPIVIENQSPATVAPVFH